MDHHPATDPADLPESDPRLVAVIREEIAAAGGRIPFARFMELALYHPDLGFYRSGVDRPTRDGDFLTAPELHPIFGWAIARQVAEAWDRLAGPPAFTLLEYGAGSGTLGLAILDGLRRERPDVARATRYQPVESSPIRRAELAARFEAAGLADRLEPPEGPAVGLVLANEFLDALPVHRVIGQVDGPVELFVTWRDGAFSEAPGPASTPALAEQLAADGIELAPGQRAEVCLGLGGWLDEVAAGLARGWLLVVDYGFPADELYARDRAGGTLRAYVRHRVHDDPFRHVGHQDLTAHVDLTALVRLATARGFRHLGTTTQAEFLAGLEAAELLVDLGRRPGASPGGYLAARAALARLVDPRALGRFRVLLFARAVPPEPPLRGLRYRLDGGSPMP